MNVPSEKDVMTALRVAGMTQKQIDALTYTRMKDGIDIQVPTNQLLAFVALIRSDIAAAS